MRRRSVLTGLGAALATGVGGGLATDWYEWGHRAQVFIAKASDYQKNLERTIAEGLCELGLGPPWARGKTVLLKPNLVEPSRARQRSTRIRAWSARRPRFSEAGGAGVFSWPRGPVTAAIRCLCSNSRGSATS